MLFVTEYCQRYDCSRREYRHHLLKRFLSRRAILLRAVIEHFKPSYFSNELELAEAIGRQSDIAGVQLEIDLYHAKSVEQSFCRRYLGLRLRCRRLKKLAYEFLTEPSGTMRHKPVSRKNVALQPPLSA